MLILNVIWKELEVVIKITILHTLKNIKHVFLAVLLTKLFVLMIDSASQLFFTKEKMRFIESLKQFLKSMITAKKSHVMSEKDEQISQSSNKCWICNKLLDVGDNKVGDQCHIT